MYGAVGTWEISAPSHFFAVSLKLPEKKKSKRKKEKNTCPKVRNIWSPKRSPLLFSDLSQVVTSLRLQLHL